MRNLFFIFSFFVGFLSSDLTLTNVSGAGKKRSSESSSSSSASNSSESSSSWSSSSSQLSSSSTSSISNKIVFEPLKGFNKDQLETLKVAEKLVNEIQESSKFKEYILKNKLTQTNGMTKETVLSTLQAAEGKVTLERYKTSNSIIGYTYITNKWPKTVYLNDKYYSGITACSAAINLTHEVIGHALGKFYHAKVGGKIDRNSVPYQAGYAAQSVCECKKGTKNDCQVKGVEVALDLAP